MTRVKYIFLCLFVHKVFSYQVCGSLFIYITGRGVMHIALHQQYQKKRSYNFYPTFPGLNQS